jgi:predicted dehydrogenase
MMDQVRVGLVGLGGNGRGFVRGYQQSEKAELVCVCDLLEERRAAVQAEAGVERTYANLVEMLEQEEFDLLSVHTSDHLHAEPFVLGLEAGRHVFVEKPMGNMMEDLDRMTEAARASDRKTMVGQILRFNPYFARIKELCANGDLGELFYLEGDYIHHLLGQGAPERFNPAIGMNWYLEREIPLVGGGIHPFDLLRWYADSTVVEVEGMANAIAFPAMKNPDCQVALFRLKSGALCKTAACYGPVGPMALYYNVTVYGTRGTVRNGTLWQGEGHDAPTTDLSALYHQGHPYNPEIEHTLECLLEDQPTLVDAFEGANSTAPVILAARSAEWGRPLEVPEYRR